MHPEMLGIIGHAICLRVSNPEAIYSKIKGKVIFNRISSALYTLTGPFMRPDMKLKADL